MYIYSCIHQTFRYDVLHLYLNCGWSKKRINHRGDYASRITDDFLKNIDFILQIVYNVIGENFLKKNLNYGEDS